MPTAVTTGANRGLGWNLWFAGIRCIASDKGQRYDHEARVDLRMIVLDFG